MPDKLIISKKRVKEFAEVFTPEHIVKDMIDAIDKNHEDDNPIPYCSRPDTKILEPSVGTGNFLVEILRRRLELISASDDDPFSAISQAVSTLYGIEIQLDNVYECRYRLLTLVMRKVSSKEFMELISQDTGDDEVESFLSAVQIMTLASLSCTIRQGDFLKITKARDKKPPSDDEVQKLIKEFFKI